MKVARKNFCKSNKIVCMPIYLFVYFILYKKASEIHPHFWRHS